jgi:competence protein CoiA
MYALNGTSRETAVPKARANCPICQSVVIAKCGRIVVWHWAHEAAADCDPWAEPDNAWHRTWQEAAPPDRREVIMGAHRADVIASDGTVVELQHSHIPVEEIAEREAFYGRMIWLFDTIKAVDSGRLDIRKRNWQDQPAGTLGGATFRWKHPRKSIAYARRPVLLDLGDGTLLWLKKQYLLGDPPHSGWGWLFSAGGIRSWLGDAT